MKEELKRQWSKVKEVGDSSPELQSLRQPIISTSGASQMGYLSIRKG